MFMPALLTRMSSRSIRPISARTRAPSFTSQTIGVARAPACSDALRYRFQIAAGSAEENQFGAGARKRDRRLRADAAARAGDQRDAAVEPEGGQDCGCS